MALGPQTNRILLCRIITVSKFDQDVITCTKDHSLLAKEAVRINPGQLSGLRG